MTRAFPVLITAVCAVCGLTLRAAAPTPSGSGSVRSLHPVLADAYEAGRERSPTFDRLAAHIAELKGIVHVVFSEVLPRGTEACVPHWIAGRETRYLRILIKNGIAGDRLIVVLGHELQHVVEALEDVTVVNATTMRGRFAKLAGKGPTRDSTEPLETPQAVAVERRIAIELSEWRRMGVR